METTNDDSKALKYKLEAQMVATFIAANYNRPTDEIARHAQQAVPDLKAILNDEARMRFLDTEVNLALKGINPTYVKETQATIAEALGRGDAKERAATALQAQSDSERAIGLYRRNPQQQQMDGKMVTDFIAANHELSAEQIAANTRAAAPSLKAILTDEGKMAMLDASVRETLKGIDPGKLRETQTAIAAALGRADADAPSAPSNRDSASAVSGPQHSWPGQSSPGPEASLPAAPAERPPIRRPLTIDGQPVSQIRYNVILDSEQATPTIETADIRLFKGRKAMAAYASLTRDELTQLIGPANTEKIEEGAGSLESTEAKNVLTGRLDRNELATIGTTAKGLEYKLVEMSEPSVKGNGKEPPGRAIPAGRVSEPRDFDYDALSRVVAARHDDRARFEQSLYLNSIEPTLENELKRARAIAHLDANTQPAPVADKGNRQPRVNTDNSVESDEVFTARKPDNSTIVPLEVEKQYLHVGNKFYHPKRIDFVAFEDKGNRLETASNSESIAESMVRIAEARGWDEIKVAGTETFRREAWLEAASRGMYVKGYTPSEVDKAILATKIRTNRVEDASAVQQQPGQQPAQESGRQETTVASSTMREHGQPAAHQANIPTPEHAIDRHAGPVLRDQNATKSTHDKENSESHHVKTQDATGTEHTTSGTNPGRAIRDEPANDRHTGQVLRDHGAAKYMHDKDNSPSYYVKTQDVRGTEHTTWGVDLERAIQESGAQLGDKVILQHEGQRLVRVPVLIRDERGRVIDKEEKEVNRNSWNVMVAEAFRKQTPEEATSKHPELAPAYATMAAIDKQGEADGLSEKQRAIVAARVRENLINSIERGNLPAIKIVEQVQVTRQRDASQELAP